MLTLLVPADDVGSLASRQLAAILVVDDEPDMVYMCRVILQSAGYDVETATDGAVALDRLAERDFDLVITDLRMPETTGEELIAELRARRVRPPIVVMSAYPDRADVTDAEAVVTKPFSASDFLMTIGSALAQR